MDLEELDDDAVIIIVGDETYSDGVFVPPMKIKQDPDVKLQDADIKLEVEKVEKLDEKDGTFSEQYLDNTVIIKEEILEEDLTKEESYDGEDMSDTEFVPEEEEEDLSESDEEKWGRKQLRPCQRRSFVADLREQYPELANNRQLLVDSLVEIMRSVRPPPLRDHYIVNGIMLECIECGELTETIPAAGRHYQEKHGPRYLICFACGVDFRSTTNLYKHEKRCSAPDAVCVLRARAVAVGNKGRHRPFLGRKQRPRNSIVGPAPTKKGFKCDLCPSLFNSKTALESHGFLHSGRRPFRCNQCECAYTSRSALWRHSKKHSDVRYICDHCSRPFNVKTALVTHLDTHLPYRKHKCEECDRRFAQKSALLLHVNSKHLNLPPPCPCQLCPKRFRRMTLLKEHMKKVHGMLLMTRKMFFKKLPTMTDTQLEQAKVILKSDETALQPPKWEPSEDVNAQFLSFIRETYDKQRELSTSEVLLRSDL